MVGLPLHDPLSAGTVQLGRKFGEGRHVQQSRIALATAFNFHVLHFIVLSPGPRTAPNHVASNRERTHEFIL